MPRLYVDQQEVSLPAAGFTSLEEILKLVEETHLPPNTLIREIQVDGLPLSSEQFQSSPSTVLERIAERDRIEIFTANVWEIATDSIREAIEYLVRIETVTPALATSFRAHPGPERFENLRQLYEGFYWLNLLLDRLQVTFQFNLDEVQLAGKTARGHHVDLMTILKELIASQERGDFILMADLMEYEILPLIPVWKGLFAALGQKVTPVE